MGAIARDPSFSPKEPESMGHLCGVEHLVNENEDVQSDLEETGFLTSTTGCPCSDSTPPFEMF